MHTGRSRKILDHSPLEINSEPYQYTPNDPAGPVDAQAIKDADQTGPRTQQPEGPSKRMVGKKAAQEESNLSGHTNLNPLADDKSKPEVNTTSNVADSMDIRDHPDSMVSKMKDSVINMNQQKDGEDLESSKMPSPSLQSPGSGQKKKMQHKDPQDL